MNDIKQYFTSPQKLCVPSTSVSPPAATAASKGASPTKPNSAAVGTRAASSKATMAAVAVVASLSGEKSAPSSPSSAHSRLIVSNMEAVISSVKKKRRAKKHKERDEPAPEICDISDILSSSLRFVSPNVSGVSSSGAADECKEERRTGTSTEMAAMDEAVKAKPANTPKKSPPSCLLSPRKSRATKSDRCSKENKHSSTRPNNPRTPSKTPTTPKKSLFTASAPPATTVTPTTTDGKPKNAFELMMNARNKSIGCNSPGKEASPQLGSPSSDGPSPTTASKTKRKLMLEAWADRKGGAKRKVEEIETDEYISRQMGKRAKRLKKLLQNGATDTDDETVIEVVVEEECPSEVEATQLNGAIKLNFKKSSTVKCVKVKKHRLKLKVFDSDEEMVISDQTDVEMTVVEVSPKSSAATCAQQQLKSDLAEVSPKSSTSVQRKSDVSAPKTPSKSPRKPAIQRRKSVYVPKTPTKSPKAVKSPVAGKSAEIVMVLSSPIKKRDSLLGYFNKIEKSPSDDDVVELVEVIPVPDPESMPLETPDETPTIEKKRRGRRPKKGQTPTTSLKTVQHSQTPTTTRRKISRECTPLPSASQQSDDSDSSEQHVRSARPKRGCREKNTNYSDNSPAKVAAQKSIKRARRLLSGGSPQKSPGKSPRLSQKLAPIFVKAPTKLAVDPEVSKARQQFLMSGIPERMKLDIERQRLFEQSYECELDVFPTVSHVTQLPSQTDDGANVVSPRLRFRVDDHPDEPENPKVFKLGTKTHPSTSSKKDLPNSDDTKIVKPKELVKYLKEIDPDKFLYFRCYKQLRKKATSDMEPLQKMAMSNVIVDQTSSNDSIEFIEQVFGNQNGTDMFTEKYKPMNPEEVVVNSAPVYQLKKFLATWQENYQSQRNRRQTSSMNDDDDFEIESNSTTNLSKSIILLGPTGSGKTNAVYALAKEMNFKVLEINAGHRRTGKKMLQELQEATQSHHVKGGGGAEKLFRGSQAPSSEESSSGFGTSSQPTQKLSLILIEDADIVFEQDHGFVDAIYQLVATSKRPVILIANQKSCPHLARFVSSNSIVFGNANEAHAGKWLSMMSIAERVYVGHDECARLYVHNGFDMRRTILEMQFFLQSGGDRERFEGCEETHYLHQTLYDAFTKNQNDAQVVSYPVDFTSIHTNTAAILKGNSSERSLTDVLDYYQTMAAAQSFQSARHGADDDGLKSNLSEEIAHFLVEGGITRMQSPTFFIDPPVKNPVMLERQLLSTGMYTGSSTVTQVSRRRSINLDVEPCLRAICRTEKIRTQTERRSSRFYHYLRNAVTSSFSTDAFDEHCSVLSDSHIPGTDASSAGTSTADQL